MSATEAAREHLAWVVGALGGRVPTEEEIVARVTTEFLLHVPPEKMIEVFGRLGVADIDVEELTEPADGRVVARTSIGPTIDLTVEPSPPHKIIGLLLKPPAALTASTAAQAVREQLSWVVSSLSRELPTEADVLSHFAPTFVAAVPSKQVMIIFGQLHDPDTAVETTTEMTPRGLRATTSNGLLVEISVEPEPPHRIDALLFRPGDPQPIDDERLSDPPRVVAAPEPLAERVAARFTSEAMVGLVAAGWRVPTPDDPTLAMAMGWADLEQDEAVTLGHRFPAYSITKLFTAIAVLRLVADGRVDLDGPANRSLTTLRLASDDATVRQLLGHTAGVASSFEHWVEEVPASLVEVLGSVAAHELPPGGPYFYSNGGYAVLGQLVADVDGRPYESVVAQDILGPLGMAESDFPRVAPWPATGVASGFDVAGGKVVPCARQVCAAPAAGGLWTTAADLARFAFGWRTLLADDDLAALVSPYRGGLWGHTGGGVGFRSVLLARPDEGLVAVAFSNRRNAVHGIASWIIDALR